MSSDLRASLLELGFNLTQARAAVAAGNTTVEAATEWIFDNNGAFTPAQAGEVASSASQNINTLQLRSDEDQAFDAELQRALEESTRFQFAPPSQPHEESATTHPAPALDNSEPAKKIKINIVRSQPTSHVIPPLPLTSRHKDEELDALNATKVAEAAKRAEKAKKDKREARLAHQRALNDLKEDRENRKIRSHHGTGTVAAESTGGDVGTASSQNEMSAPESATSSENRPNTIVQLRLKNGTVLKRSFESCAMVKNLFDLARAEDGNIGSADISLIQTPIPAPQPINPGAWLSTDVEMGEPPVADQDEVVQGHENEGGEDQDHAIDDEENPADDINEDDEDEEDEDEDMMHALPIHINQQQNPFGGRGRGRGGGRGGLPFSGVGHALISGASVSGHVQHDSQTQLRTEESDALRRQRILDATANRTKDNAANIMLTANDAKSNKHLKLLGEEVGSQVAEAIVLELIKLKQLDQLSFRRLHKCSVVNMVLDAYSRATDSLMDTIGACQARSLTYLSLKECTFLTDKGFRNIGRFEELEYLDLSHCRITDKTLEFILNLRNLGTLHLSSTKITSAGLAKIIAEAAWKGTLHTLDMSYCQGIAGSSVLLNLQELLNLRTLRLSNTLAFNRSPVQVPDCKAFTRLLDLDIARTPIGDDDLITLIGSFRSVESLNMTSCPNIGIHALEQCVQGIRDRLASNGLPLTHLDLTGFLFVTDDAILTLAEAKNLQMLSLAGTKLTDIGSAVFVHMSSLKELSLDRTSIGDKSMEYLRDLGRIEVLSLHRCQRLTTVGVVSLGKCAFFSLRLKRLNLGYNQFIHDEALAIFTRCKELTTLNLEYTDVSEERALRLQNSLPTLTQLRIQGVTNGAVYEENPRGISA
ncbi:hypothetical protein BGX28_007427 [Mortierella sp. GBA30]|nr:hypothetical protein BGX28_007427 [Mortierella sp. GBA30]